MAKKITKDKTGRLGLRTGNPDKDDAQVKLELLKRWNERTAVLKEITDSPIELSLAQGVSYLWAEVLGGDLHYFSTKTTLPTAFPDGLSIVTQMPIPPYRVDFFMVIKYGDESTSAVIECDGHEFHERTKAQAARDRSRDRAMALKGITVLRFTGSEIHKDLMDCSEEVLQNLGVRHANEWK